MVNFSNCLHEEFPIKMKLMITSKTLSTVCFLTVPGPGCSKLGSDNPGLVLDLNSDLKA